ncbi:MAG: M14 family zinc carboxypeptidase [Acidobacteriota bacterium]
MTSPRSMAVLVFTAFASLTLATPALAERHLQLSVHCPDEDAVRRLLRLGHSGHLHHHHDAHGHLHADLVLPESVLPELVEAGLHYEVIHEDLVAHYQARLTRWDGERRAGGEVLARGSMGGYFTLEEIIGEMDALQAEFPELVEPKESMADTEQGRPIWIWKVSARAALDEDEPAILYMSLMHAREPAGMMSLFYFVDRLVRGYGTDAEATYLLDHRELWIIPVLNPDGYNYNQTSTPAGGGLWRKNRRDNGDGRFGVDLNRNFSYEWGLDDTGSSGNTRSDVYRGEAPFSEPETQALRDFCIEHEPKIAMNTHTYGDDLIFPWEHVDEPCPEAEDYRDIGRGVTRGNAYSVGTPGETIGYLANGTHDDYMHGETTEKPVVYGMTHECGDSGDGFWPATARILPIAEELEPANRWLAWASGPNPRVLTLAVDDTAGGDSDGRAEPGETVRLFLTARNRGLVPTWGLLEAQLVSDDCSAIVEDGTSSYGELEAQATWSNSLDPFLVRIPSGVVPGQRLDLSVTFVDDRGAYPPQRVGLTIGQPVVLFEDDFETGTGSWNIDGWGTEAAGAGRSGEVLSDSPNRNHGNGDDDTAEADVVLDLSGMGHAWLVFEQRFLIDNERDGGFVEVSTDGGLNWDPVAGEVSDVGTGDGVQPEDWPVYDGRLDFYETEHVDLTPFVGLSDLRFRFRFRSNGNITHDGWRIDDVRVEAFVDCPTCGCQEECDNGVDDDGDGDVDCDDADCTCIEICDDGVDNDRDGLTDCDDPDCSDDPACPEDCVNGVDDDADGDVDCDDSECADVDADGDTHLDCVDDCLVTDGTIWAPPTTVLDLRVGWDPDTRASVLSWTDETGPFGPGTGHDVHSGRLSELRDDLGLARAECRVDDLLDLTHPDVATDLMAGDGWYYLVRLDNACGVGPIADFSYGPRVLPVTACDP